MSEFAKLPDRAELEKLLHHILIGTGATIVSMELEHVELARIPYKLVILVDAADGYGFTFNHAMPDLDLIKSDVRAVGKIIRQHLEARNGSDRKTAAGVH